jgi:hypothetical protein
MEKRSTPLTNFSIMTARFISVFSSYFYIFNKHFKNKTTLRPFDSWNHLSLVARANYVIFLI